MVKFSSLAIISFSTALTFSTSVLAATHFLPEYEDKWGSFSSGIKNSIPHRVKDEQDRCFATGYKITSCPEGFAAKISERCPYSLDKNYYKQCYSLASICVENGYTTSCGDGYVADTSRPCPHDSSYTKCKAEGCNGYGYTADEANEAGYVADGEPCLSGSEYKYKRKPNPCTGYGYDSSNCGTSSCGTLSGETCLSGTVTKYKTCEACAAPVVECGAGEVDLDTYWCNGALRCWWKAGITACIPTNSCSDYNLASQNGCDRGYESCDNGCGTVKYKCATCTVTQDCSEYHLASQSGCSHGYESCDNGCGTTKYKCASCTPTEDCSDYNLTSQSGCSHGYESCENGCGTTKYKCAACTPTKDCSDYNLTSQSGCSHGYESCENGCGTTKYKCKACAPTKDCSDYNLTSKSGCSYGYESCENGCGTTKYKCKACSPTKDCSGYSRVSSDTCPIGADECNNGCGTKKYKCKLYKVGDNYSANGVFIGRVIAVNNSKLTIASQPSVSSKEAADYCNSYGVNWSAPNKDQGAKTASAYQDILTSSFHTLRITGGNEYNYCVNNLGTTHHKDYCTGSYYTTYNACVTNGQQIEE